IAASAVSRRFCETITASCLKRLLRCAFRYHVGHAQACRVVAQCDFPGVGGGSAFEEVPKPGGSQDDGRRRGERGAKAQRSGDDLHYGRERQFAVPAKGRWRFIEYNPVRAEEGEVCGDLWTAFGGGGGFVEERKSRDAGF